MARKLCVKCEKAQAVRAGGVCNRCFVEAIPRERFETWRVADLRPHPVNAGIYGDSPDHDMVASVRAFGVRIPPIVTPDKVIIAGHRRVAGARGAGLVEIRVQVVEFPDELDAIEFLLLSNRARKKTNAMWMQEVVQFRRIDNERRKRNSEANLKRGDAHGEDGEPAMGPWHIAASMILDMDRKTAQRLDAVAKELNTRTANGDEEGAEALRQLLDDSITKAYDSIRSGSSADGTEDATTAPDDASGVECFDLDDVPPDEGAPADNGPATDEEEDDDTDDEAAAAPKPPKRGQLTEADLPDAMRDAPRDVREQWLKDMSSLPVDDQVGLPLDFVEERVPFGAVNSFKEAIRLASDLDAMISSIAREYGGEYLKDFLPQRMAKEGDNPPALIPTCTEIANLIKILKRHMPHCRYCPACAAAGRPDNRKGCKTCFGRLFVPRKVWDITDDEGRSSAKAQAAKK